MQTIQLLIDVLASLGGLCVISFLLFMGFMARVSANALRDLAEAANRPQEALSAPGVKLVPMTPTGVYSPPARQ